MNVLLLSMPDSFEHMSQITVRMPNGALGSLAGNVDSHHRVEIADLILTPDRVRATVEHLVRSRAPDVVGLSVMTFQRRTAHALIRLIRTLRPQARIVVGGRIQPDMPPETAINSGGNKFRGYDKATGETVWETELPAGTTGPPVTYMFEGKQYLVVAIGDRLHAAELIAFALP